MTAEQKDLCLKMVQATLASTQDVLTLQQLSRDYKQVTGDVLDVRQFGYNSLRQFILDSPDRLRLDMYQGHEVVLPVITKELERVNKLVQNQKPSKSKRRFMPKRPDIYQTPQRRKVVPTIRKPSLANSTITRYPATNLYCPPHRSNPPPKTVYQTTTSSAPKLQQKSVHQRLTYPAQKQPKAQSPAQTQPATGKNSTSGRSTPPDALKKNKPAPVKKDNSEDLLKKLCTLKSYSMENKTYYSNKSNDHIVYFRLVSADKSFSRVFSSSPVSCSNQEEATEVACKRALTTLLEDNESQKLKETQDTDLAIQRLVEFTKDIPAGIFLKALLEQYKTKFNQQIPESLLKQLQKNEIGTFDVQDSIGGPIVIYQEKVAVSPVEDSIIRDPQSYIDNLEEGHQVFPCMVTFVANTTDVGFSIWEKDYIVMYDELATQLELAYYDEDAPVPKAKELVVDESYCIQADATVYRVRYLGMKDDSARVLYLDFGHEALVSPDELHTYLPQFSDFPFSVLYASLTGLELAGHIQEVSEALCKIRYVYCTVDRVSPSMSVTFYEDDVCINEKLANLVPDNILAPNLNNPIVRGLISHVTDSGDVFFNLDTDKTKIEDIREESGEMASTGKPLAKVTTNDINARFMVKTLNRGWQRATILEILMNDEVLIEHIDLGSTEKVPVGSLFPLAPISKVYSKVAPQAVKCRLQHVPPKNTRWTPDCTKALNEMCNGIPLMIRIHEERGPKGEILVDMFKKTCDAAKELVSINASLMHDPSLYDDDTCNTKISSPNKKNTSSAALSNSGRPNIDVPADPYAVLELPVKRIPPVSDFFDVVVSCAANPNNFVVRPYRTSKEFKDLKARMSSFYSVERNLSVVLGAVVRGYYAAMDNNKTWHRVQIVSVTEPMILCSCVDEGEIFCISLDQLQPLRPQFRELPPQAFKATLQNVAPVNGDWTPEDCCRFKELVHNMDLVSFVYKISFGADHTPLLGLALYDTSGSTDVVIEKLLEQEGRAKLIEC